MDIFRCGCGGQCQRNEALGKMVCQKCGKVNNYVFISYSTENQGEADSIRHIFMEQQIQVWMAPYDIPPGGDFSGLITDALENCAALVLLLTKDAQGSAYVRKEVNLAIALNKPVLPARLEELVLNRQFRFLLVDSQIWAVPKIDVDDPEFRQLLKVVKSLTEEQYVELAYKPEDRGAVKPETHVPAAVEPPKAEVPKQPASTTPSGGKPILTGFQRYWKGCLAAAAVLLGIAVLPLLKGEEKQVKSPQMPPRESQTVAASMEETQPMETQAPTVDPAEQKYQEAVVLMDTRDYTLSYEAYQLFEELGSYKNSEQLALRASSWSLQERALSAGEENLVGLRTDGTVVAVGYNRYGQCDVTGWEDIIAVSTEARHTVGLRSDGTVAAVGDNDYGQCDVDNWADIIAVSAGYWHTVGLQSDGTVAAVGYNGDGQCDVVDEWTDIIAISAGEYHTAGLKADGTVVSTCNGEDCECDVSTWTNIGIPK